MHICRKVNLASSSSWMYFAYIPLLVDLISPLIDFFVSKKKGENIILFLLYPFVDDWQKGGRSFKYICMFFLALYIKGEKNFLFMHIFLFCKIYMHVFPCFIHKGGEEFLVYAYCFVFQKGEKNLMSFMLDWHVYLLIFAYMFV